jgi:hypothetical protein
MAIDRINATALLDGGVTTADIADDAVTTAKINAGAVGTTELADDAVTSAKLDTNIAVTGDLTVDTNTLYVDSTNNRVGVGTILPSQSLHVVGEGLFEKASADSVVAVNSTGGSGRSYQIRSQNSGDFYIYDNTAGAARATIDSSGNVGIGTTNPSTPLDVTKAGGTNWVATFQNTSATSYGVNAAEPSGASVGYPLLRVGQGYSPYADYLRVDTGGTVLVGTTSVTGNGVSMTGNGYGRLYIGRTNADAVAEFYYQGSRVGSIGISSTNTSYFTSSDYRLKENVEYDFDATTRIKQLKPARFNFIADADTTVDGFLAHEVQDVVPEAITGTKDAMRDEEYEVTPAVLDEDGNVVTPAVMGTRSVPDYQGIDQAKLVPLLVKSLQEALDKIDTLETRLEALESA